MDVLPADDPAIGTGGVAASGVGAALHAGDSFAGAALDPPELFDVDMDQLAGPLALVALGRRQTQAPELAHPAALEHRPTVDSGNPSSSASSGPENRSRRSAQIAATVCASVRLATTCGAEERSSRPGGPWARKRASHLRAVRSLMPADSAAAWTVQLSLSTRSTNNRRPIGLSRALA
jgi:hypothetical protein